MTRLSVSNRDTLIGARARRFAPYLLSGVLTTVARRLGKGLDRLAHRVGRP